VPHDDENDRQTSEFAAEVNSTPVRESDLKAFFGPNADCYLGAYYASGGAYNLADESDLIVGTATRERDPAFYRSFLWVGFFFPLCWLLYRKLYLHAAIYLIIPIVLGFLAPNWGSSIVDLGMMIFMLVRGKRLYVSHALRRIAKANERGLTEAERRNYMERVGGVSFRNLMIVIFAPIFLVLAIAAVMLATGIRMQDLSDRLDRSDKIAAVRALPSCADKAVTDIAAKILATASFSPSSSPSAWSLAGISDRTRSGAGDRYECHATATAGKVTATIDYTVTWKDAEKKGFNVHLSAEHVTLQ
jgi:hypothetical protein